jgi:Transmembrane domain of unknown function (DUF3566)
MEGSITNQERVIAVLEIAAYRLAATLGADHPQTLACLGNLYVAELGLALASGSPARASRAASALESVSRQASAALGEDLPQVRAAAANAALARQNLETAPTSNRAAATRAVLIGAGRYQERTGDTGTDREDEGGLAVLWPDHGSEFPQIVSSRDESPSGPPGTLSPPDSGSGTKVRMPLDAPESPKGSDKATAVTRPARPVRRQAMMTLHRLEPWSVLKVSFAASLVAFIVLFTAVGILYPVMSTLGILTWLQNTVTAIFTSGTPAAARQVASWFSASRILGWTAMLGALNVVLITSLSTIGAVIYNLIARSMGGVEITLREID